LLFPGECYIAVRIWTCAVSQGNATTITAPIPAKGKENLSFGGKH